MGSHGNGANQPSHGDLLISRELIESTLELIADRLVFPLLLDQVGFKFITFLLEFSGLSLALSGASLSVLESGAEITNGLLVRLFAGKGLSLGNFEGLHVVADDLQLFLQLLDLGFSIIRLLDLLVGGFGVGVGGGEIFCGGVEVVLNLLDLLVQGVDLIVTLFEVALELLHSLLGLFCSVH